MNVRQRQPRIECPAFLAFVRLHPCCACGVPPRSQAAHIRMGCIEIGKRPTGIAEKPSDRYCTPLCAGCHLDNNDSQHRVGEPEFWKRVGRNPFEIAAALYAEFKKEQPATEHQAQRAKRRRTKKQAKNPALRKAPSRPIQSANRWPPRGTQKIRSAPFKNGDCT